MWTAVCVFILTFSTLCGPRVVSGALSTPTNVRLTSFNMDLVLRWDPAEQPASGLLYTAEYKSTIADSPYRVGCANTSTPYCDFTTTNNNNIFQYGRYTGRVRAQAGNESSAWVESNQISMDRDTIIGSPNVTLFPNGATIEVSIKDPVFTISAFRTVYPSANFMISYWKDGQKEKATNISNMQQNRVVLSPLEPWTKYCVQVKIHIATQRNPNNSKPSRAVCESTTSDEEAPWMSAVVMFVVLAMAVALVAVAVVYRKNISNFLCPKDVLPQHFKEYLLAPPKPSMYLVSHNSHPPEEIYHPVSIIADSRPLEEGLPLEAAGSDCSQQPDSTTGDS